MRAFGRAPDLAIGNAGGDIELLRTAGIGSLLVHDDDTREYACAADLGEPLRVARERGWITVSMRDDWLEVF